MVLVSQVQCYADDAFLFSDNTELIIIPQITIPHSTITLLHNYFASGLFFPCSPSWQWLVKLISSGLFMPIPKSPLVCCSIISACLLAPSYVKIKRKYIQIEEVAFGIEVPHLFQKLIKLALWNCSKGSLRHLNKCNIISLNF